MNTKDTPFAESFGKYGDPRRYMNSPSVAKKIEATVAKIKNSPVAGLLGIGLAGGGEAAPSPTPALGQGISAPVAPSIGINPNAPSGVGIAPGSFQIPNLTMPQVGSPATPAQDLDGDGQVDKFWGVQPAAVPQSSAVDVNNRTDFNTFVPDTGNQVALTGNEYQQIPGFGSAQEKAGKLLKIMGMG